MKTSSLMKINEDLGKKRNKVIIEDIPVEKKVDLSTPVLCLGINADGKYLAVVTKEMGQLHVLFYDINGVADTVLNPELLRYMEADYLTVFLLV